MYSELSVDWWSWLESITSSGNMRTVSSEPFYVNFSPSNIIPSKKPSSMYQAVIIYITSRDTLVFYTLVRSY